MLEVGKNLIAEMITHSLEMDPEECCGLLLGRERGSEGSFDSLRRITNVHESRVSWYTMDPLEVMKVEREADGLGIKILAIYHSHTYTQGYPSETDIKNAVDSGWGGRYYLLISLVEKTRPVVRAFWISETGEVEETFINSV